MKSKETKLKRTSGSKDKVKPKKERKSTVKDPKKTKSPIIYAHEQWSMGYKFPSNIYQAYLIAGMTHEGEQNANVKPKKERKHVVKIKAPKKTKIKVLTDEELTEVAKQFEVEYKPEIPVDEEQPYDPDEFYSYHGDESSPYSDDYGNIDGRVITGAEMSRNLDICFRKNPPFMSSRNKSKQCLRGVDVHEETVIPATDNSDEIRPNLERINELEDKLIQVNEERDMLANKCSYLYFIVLILFLLVIFHIGL